ncbi:MAG: hypothetical protein ACTSUB_01305 [Candidatus Thorarchaeota archaeon]
MTRKAKFGSALKNHINRYNLHDRMRSMLSILGDEAQQVVDWAEKESERKTSEGDKPQPRKGTSKGRIIYDLIGTEAVIKLVKENHRRGRLTTKAEIKKRTGQKVEMPLIYREAGLRHPQEARNLRHNIFHGAFLALIMKIFPEVTTSVPATGTGLTPDLMVHSEKPKWTISVEYKGYRSITLLSESELLKGMRYQDAYGTAWLVTSTIKSVNRLYGPIFKSNNLVKQGIKRLENISKRKVYTSEQRENRGIAKKGLIHLGKHKDDNLTCKHITAQDILESCKKGKPLKGLAITTGFEFVDLLREHELYEEADSVLKIMKSPTNLLHSDTVESVRLIG